MPNKLCDHEYHNEPHVVDSCTWAVPRLSVSCLKAVNIYRTLKECENRLMCVKIIVYNSI